MPINELNRGLTSKYLRAKFHKNRSNILGAIAVWGVKEDITRSMTRQQDYTRGREQGRRKWDCSSSCAGHCEVKTSSAPSSSSSSQWWRGHTTMSVCLSVWRGESDQWAGAARACVALHTSHSLKAHSERPTAETWTWRTLAALSSSSYSRPRWQPCSPPTSSSTRPSSRRDVIWRARVETCWPCTTRARSTTAPSSTPGQLFVALLRWKFRVTQGSVLPARPVYYWTSFN